MTTKQFNEKQEKLIKESVHQYRVCKWLTQHNLVFFAVPNGYKKSKFQQAQAKREGLKSGVPDLIIISKNKNGQSTVLEMKRYKGSRHKCPCNCIEGEQAVWRDTFIHEGWTYILGHGADEAIQDLEILYDIK